MDNGNDCTGREAGTEMSALDELKKKNPISMTMLEFVVTQAEYSEVSGNAEHAAEELAALQAELAFFHGAFPSASKNYADMIKRQKA